MRVTDGYAVEGSRRLYRIPTNQTIFSSWRVILAMLVSVLFIQSVRAQTAPWPAHDVDYPLDSGVVRHSGSPRAEVAWTDLVDVPDACWVRLFFETMDLGYDVETGARATLRITSFDDGATQHLDAMTAAQWRSTTAYFNGSTVSLELIVDPGAPPSRLVLDHVRAGDAPSVEPDSLCGPTDDRELSNDPRIGRGEYGCTHWLIDDNHHCLISAGHCEYSFTVIEFNVPLSDPHGRVRHPGPEDQYPIDPDSVQFENGGMGQDWAHYGLFPNSETGLTAYQKQGDAFGISAPPEPTGAEHVRVTGYGVVSDPVDPRWNNAQKTHVGDYVDIEGTRLRYTADTTSGNSGSPVILEGAGVAIGVHTHGGCNKRDGTNSGTSLAHAPFTEAIANPIGLCGAFELDVDQLRVGQLSTARARGVAPLSRVYFMYSRAGRGSSNMPELGINLGIRQPVLSGVAIADHRGVALHVTLIPLQARGEQLWLQAATVGRASEVIERYVGR